MPVCSPVASRYDARVADVLPAKCISWSLDPQMTEDLDDKVVFCQMAADAGLTVPKTHRVCSHAEVHEHNRRLAAAHATDPKQPRCIFKNLQVGTAVSSGSTHPPVTGLCFRPPPSTALRSPHSPHRPSLPAQYDSMHRLDLFTLPCEPAKLDAYLDKLVSDGVTIDEANPWAVQTFLVGQEYSTCAFAKDGQMLAFTDNQASISCFNYKAERSSLMREWVGTFCKTYSISGIVSPARVTSSPPHRRLQLLHRTSPCC